MITRLEIDGYRLLNDFLADLGQLTVVIGPNASGKSTLLDCLQCVAQCTEFPINRVMGWHWGMNSLTTAGAKDMKLSWKVVFKKPTKGSLWDGCPLKDDRLYAYEVVLQGNPTGQASVQYEVLRNHEASPGHDEPFKYLETTPYRSHVYDKARHNLVPFDEAVPQQQVVRESAGQPVDEQPVDLLTPPQVAQEAALRLSQMRFFNEFPIPSTARLLLSRMVFYPGFDVSRSAPVRLSNAEIRPETVLLPNAENLGSVLHEIFTRYDYRASADDLREFFMAAYPWVEDLNAETAYAGTPARVLVRVREKGSNRPIELWELSDGMLRFLCIGVALLNPAPPPFVAVDEPEIGLHPRLLPILGDMIKAASEHTQVLVTTHSPDLLNCFTIDDVAVMTRGEEPKATWRRPRDRKTLVQMLEQVSGETLGDLHRSGELEVAE